MSAAFSMDQGVLSLTPVGEAQVRADVQACLKDALAQAGVPRDDIVSGFKVSAAPLSMKEGGWNLCLANLEARLVRMNRIYAVYDHKRRFSEETHHMTFAEACGYLTQRAIDYLNGVDI